MDDDYYNKIAPSYDGLHGDEQKKKMDIIRKMIKITPETRILDIGCGSGISSDFECICIGIDPSERLVEIARKRAGEKDHRYIVAKAEDIGKLGFKEKEFDYILCITAIHHLADLEDTLLKIKGYGKGFVFTVLKKASSKQKIINTIAKNFKILKTIEEEKDIIMSCAQ